MFAQTQQWDGAMVRQDGALLYPVREGIPVLLWEERLEIEEGSRSKLVRAFELHGEKFKN